MTTEKLEQAEKWTVESGRMGEARPDSVAVEEPLEIRLRAGEERRTVAVTMRTPGHDAELAVGFLYGEQILQDIRALKSPSSTDTTSACPAKANEIEIRLDQPELPPLPQLERHFFTNSACGVCGKVAIEKLQARRYAPNPSNFTVPVGILHGLPSTLRKAQVMFDRTGGLHAAALFDRAGHLLALREDVGRHNALDKLVGWGFLSGRLPFRDGIVMVSGRASFELLQKCVVAGASVFCAVSAPSSLAVTVAKQFRITLVGFLREERFNVYSWPERIIQAAGD